MSGPSDEELIQRLHNASLVPVHSLDCGIAATRLESLARSLADRDAEIARLNKELSDSVVACVAANNRRRRAEAEAASNAKDASIEAQWQERQGDEYGSY